ncbi:hypothetical protein GCM10027280_22660 [Micromonospora polyrhachis]
MVQYAHVTDADGALTAAARFAARTSEVQSVGTSALSLVARTAALAPLFGDDDAGRRYRKNYDGAAPDLERMIQTFCAGLAEIGIETGKLLSQVVEHDDPRVIRG